MTYRAPIKVLENLRGLDSIAALPGFENADLETAQAVVEECAKLCKLAVAPLSPIGDKSPATWSGGVVTTSSTAVLQCGVYGGAVGYQRNLGRARHQHPADRMLAGPRHGADRPPPAGGADKRQVYVEPTFDKGGQQLSGAAGARAGSAARTGGDSA